MVIPNGTHGQKDAHTQDEQQLFNLIDHIGYPRAPFTAWKNECGPGPGLCGVEPKDWLAFALKQCLDMEFGANKNMDRKIARMEKISALVAEKKEQFVKDEAERRARGELTIEHRRYVEQQSLAKDMRARYENLLGLGVPNNEVSPAFSFVSSANN